MCEIYQERNLENEVPNLKGTLNPDEIENKNKISSSSNNSIVIHSEKFSNIDEEKEIKKSSSNLIESNCNYANTNSNKGSNIYNLDSKKNSEQSLIESNQSLEESNQSLNENKKEITKIKNDIKKSLEKYSEELINENKGDFISNGFSKIKVIKNKNKEIKIKENENKITIKFNYKKYFNGNFKWKFIQKNNFNLNEETIEKYSLNLIEKKCVYSLNDDNSIEFNFDLNDNKKNFLVFAIGLYNNNQILFTNTIILFFIDLNNCNL